jgi:uncharacterized cupin superfamily protein
MPDVEIINVSDCVPDLHLDQGAFRCSAFRLTERLGSAWIGATVYEMQAGDKRGPYHYHQGVEEWMYVVAGSPILRDPTGERPLAPGELVAFESGAAGAHTMHGPGRVVMFSAGWTGWGEAFVSVYPDSDKIAAAPGVIFRRADAIESWTAPSPPNATSPQTPADGLTSGGASPAINVLALDVPSSATRPARVALDADLDTRTWAPTLYELAAGESTGPYHHEWCREHWALILAGAITLRHSDGEVELHPGDIACFAQGPTGAHELRNDTEGPGRLLLFSTPTHRPMSAFFPDQGVAEIRLSDHEGFKFRLDDQIADYWDGEPGANTST